MDIHFAAGGAGSVNGDFERFALVFGFETDGKQEMGKLDDAAGAIHSPFLVLAAFKQRRPMVFHHTAARTGRYDNRPVFGEKVKLRFGDIEGFGRMAG
ncbi:Uncharacterised protein [Neisseria meningitidis]|nr:Uncharacterised protein [Neisseria meningitidis]